jgi:hypothetical protein
MFSTAASNNVPVVFVHFAAVVVVVVVISNDNEPCGIVMLHAADRYGVVGSGHCSSSFNIAWVLLS